MKYIRKQEVVEAIQYTNLKEAKRFLGIKDANYDKYTRDLIIRSTQVNTMHGVNYIAEVGCYIIKNEFGAYFTLTKEDFLEYYYLAEKLQADIKPEDWEK